MLVDLIGSFITCGNERLQGLHFLWFHHLHGYCVNMVSFLRIYIRIDCKTKKIKNAIMLQIIDQSISCTQI